jgi:hypothetical protein
MKVIDRGELARYREHCEVLSTRLFAGRTVLHIHSDHDPATASPRSTPASRTSTFHARPVAPRGLRRNDARQRRPLRVPLPAPQPAL